MKSNRNSFTALITLSLIMLSQLSSSFAETVHEEGSLYRDITVAEIGEPRCLLFNVNRGDRKQACV